MHWKSIKCSLPVLRAVNKTGGWWYLKWKMNNKIKFAYSVVISITGQTITNMRADNNIRASQSLLWLRKPAIIEQPKAVEIHTTRNDSAKCYYRYRASFFHFLKQLKTPIAANCCCCRLIQRIMHSQRKSQKWIFFPSPQVEYMLKYTVQVFTHSVTSVFIS